MTAVSSALRLAGAIVAAVFGAASTAQAQSKPKSTLPDTSIVTDKLIAEGRGVFRGHGGCVVCHGQNLEGVVGPTLKAHKWKDAENGDFAAIIRVVTTGVPGTVMVSHPNGVSDPQIVAVAAYIWGVNRGRTKP